MIALLIALFVCVVAYLCGSVSSAVIVCRFFDLPDPRAEGSKNPGATNVLRLAGKSYAGVVLFVDMLKGLLPVLLAKWLDVSLVTLGFTCLAAVIGHIYPIFFGFKGGKGVATAMGAMFGLHFMLGIAVLITWIVVANLSKYSSLASLVSMGLAPLYMVVMVRSFDAFPALFFITLLIFFKHNENILRLIDGKENKMALRSRKKENSAANDDSVSSKK